MSKILIVGDLHLQDHLGYYNTVKDFRESEKKEILDFITNSSSDCEKVVFLGDQFDKKNNPSSVVKDFTAFLESFHGKDIFIIAGNHEKTPSGESALDYLQEIVNDKWNLIINDIFVADNLIFCPYLYRSELKAKTDEEATKKVIDMLSSYADKENNILFCHFAISDTLTSTGLKTDCFREVVLPNKKISSMFHNIFSGHVHNPQIKNNIIVTGSIFNNEITETGKYIYKYDTETGEYETIKLPGRSIVKIIDPQDEDLKSLNKDTIVKVVLTKKNNNVDNIKKELSSFPGFTISEQYPNERKKIKNGESVSDMSIEEKLSLYADTKKIDKEALLKGWDLINK